MKQTKSSPAPATPFQSVTDAAKTTGLSTFFLRRGLRDGTIPHIKSGNKYLINIPRLLEVLNAAPAYAGGSNG